MSIYKGDTLIAGSGLNIVTIYDMTSNDSSINWGYTSGIQGGNTAISGTMTYFANMNHIYACP